MVKLKRFDIEFNNPERVYFAGQEIGGKIVIELIEDKLINEILLELKGRARTYWTKHSGKSRTHCTHSEPYFCEQLNTKFTHSYGRMTSDGKFVERIVPAGTHEIPFSYTLPKNLPTSFEGEYGFIRYTCRAICERPWDFDIVSYSAFSVVGIEDINCDTETLAPVTVSESNYNIRFCCRKQGSVNIELTMARTGYTPGETIRINALVNNQSPKTIKASYVRLKQLVDYKAKTFSGTEHIKSVSRLIEKKEKGEIAPHSEMRWTNEPVVIPSLTPRLSKCSIISITYIVEFEADSSVTVQIPIVIGSIPRLSDIVGKMTTAALKSAKLMLTTQLNNKSSKNSDDSSVRVMITDEAGQTLVENNDNSQADDLLSIETETLIQSKKRVRMPSSILSELYPTLPSPYYKDSHFGTVDISDEKECVQYGQSKFAPKYPFYTD